MGQKLTKGDVAKIEAEIEHRKIDLRPELTRAVAEAAAQGDRSENFEYYAAKRENNQNNSRIRYLERVLRTAVIVDNDTAPSDVVSVDKDVRVYIVDDDEEESYTLVTPIRADALHGIISIESPLGRALLNHKVGETVTVKANDSYSYQARILEIRESERAGGLNISSF